MQTISLSFSLDLSQRGMQKALPLQQGEANIRTLVIRLRDGLTPLPLDATDYVVLRAISPDGSHIFNDCRVEEGAVCCLLSQQILAAVGTVQCELCVYSANEQILYSPHFSLEVAASPLFGDDYVEASDEFTALETAMYGYLNAQSQVDAAEATCTAAEGERAVAETARTAAEQIRQASEAERITAEVIRADAELNRNDEESDRVTAEATRASAESNRAAAESTRVNTETARISAEGGRVTAEAARATAENERTTTEQGRVSNEITRVNAEIERQTAEDARAAAENSRGSTFQTTQDDRAADFAAAEASRAAAFSSAQTDRAADYAAAELMREAACTAAISEAEDAANAANAAALACAPHDTHERRIQTLETMYNGTHVYGVKWDGVQAQCTRLFDAEGITTDVTHFCHRGSIDPDYSNPFDSIYPWSGRRVCNVDLTVYQALTPGSDIKGCIAAWEGDPDFAWDGSNGSVMVYTPAFWAKQWQEEDGLVVAVSDAPLPGWIHYTEMIGGRWFACDDGNGSLISKPGLMLLNTALSDGSNSLHARARATGQTLDDLWTWCATNVLLVVEYATLNAQAAIGLGDISARENVDDLCTVAQTNAGSVIVSNATAAYYTARINCVLDIGTTFKGYQVGRRILASITDYDAENKRLNFESGTLTTAVGDFVCCHNMKNTVDAALGSASGYLGKSFYCHAYYRGQISHGGRYRYLLGAYRQSGTNRIWTAADRAAADLYDALDATAHIDTSFTLPNDGNGFIKELYASSAFPLAPFVKAIGGSSSAPVSDMFWAVAPSVADSVTMAGSDMNVEARMGRFKVNWNASSTSSQCSISAIPWLKQI